ncbi:MAG: hypothetical protein ACXVEF_22370 [Polyangiales bacterium]
MRHLRLALLALAIGGAAGAACVIGPKQDDPVSGDTTGPSDGSTGEDSAGGGSDLDAALTDESGSVSDTGVVPAPPDAIADGDARGDAPDAVSSDGALDGDADGDASDAADGD